MIWIWNLQFPMSNHPQIKAIYMTFPVLLFYGNLLDLTSLDFLFGASNNIKSILTVHNRFRTSWNSWSYRVQSAANVRMGDRICHETIMVLQAYQWWLLGWFCFHFKDIFFSLNILINKCGILYSVLLLIYITSK